MRLLLFSCASFHMSKIVKVNRQKNDTAPMKKQVNSCTPLKAEPITGKMRVYWRSELPKIKPIKSRVMRFSMRGLAYPFEIYTNQ